MKKELAIISLLSQKGGVKRLFFQVARKNKSPMLKDMARAADVLAKNGASLEEIVIQTKDIASFYDADRVAH